MGLWKLLVGHQASLTSVNSIRAHLFLPLIHFSCTFPAVKTLAIGLLHHCDHVPANYSKYTDFIICPFEKNCHAGHIHLACRPYTARRPAVSQPCRRWNGQCISWAWVIAHRSEQWCILMQLWHTYDNYWPFTLRGQEKEAVEARRCMLFTFSSKWCKVGLECGMKAVPKNKRRCFSLGPYTLMTVASNKLWLVIVLAKIMLVY